MTDVENRANEILQSLGFEVKHYKEKHTLDKANCFYFQCPFKNMLLDFANLNSKIALEVDGNYWHGVRTNSLTASQVKAKLRDAQKNHDLTKSGWGIIRIAGSDLLLKNASRNIRERIFSMLAV